MSDESQYTIITQIHVVKLDKVGNPSDMVEITFEYGEGKTGRVYANPDTATRESNKQAILDYIKRFTV